MGNVIPSMAIKAYENANGDLAKIYKVLDKHGCSCHGGEAEWSLPTRNADGTWTPGEWMPEVEGELEPCRNGYHVVTLEQLPGWLGERIFEVEVGDEIVHAGGKSVVRTCRLTRECTGWNERTARLFACDCAERVLPLYEAYYDDDSPRKAIEVARRYAEGKATVEELASARDAAWAAAEAASLNTSLAAAEAAAGVASRDAARDAARYVTWHAARAVWEAAWAARDAAWATAWTTALNASRAAAEAASLNTSLAAAEAAALNAARDAAVAAARAARDAERQWQVERLRKILEVEA